MAFLPEEFRRAQEQSRAHFPSHHVGPLVDHHRQVAIAADPLGEAFADHGFRGRAHHQRAFQFTRRNQLAVFGDQAVVRDHRHFLGEAFDVRGFFFDQFQRNEQREIAVLVTGFANPLVQTTLQVFPDAEAPWLDHHAAAYAGIFRHVGLFDHFLVPLGEVVFAADADGGLFGLVGHGCFYRSCTVRGVAQARERPVSVLLGIKQSWPEIKG